MKKGKILSHKGHSKIFLRSKNGFFGSGKNKFGGCYVPEILYPVLCELQKAYEKIVPTKAFQREFTELARQYIGRPTPLIYAKSASKILKNEIYLKFEGLANTGAHKINNALGQALLAKKMGKKLVIAETGAGQHGLATAAACAKLGLACKIFMGAIDVARQAPNVFNMRLLGAEVISVQSGSKTLKDAVNEAMRQWARDPADTFYVLGSALGPAPYPDMVRDFQSIIGREVRKEAKRLGIKNGAADIMIACVGGGSNSMGFFSEFLLDKNVRLIGVEAGGVGNGAGENAARFSCFYPSLKIDSINSDSIQTDSIESNNDSSDLKAPKSPKTRSKKTAAKADSINPNSTLQPPARLGIAQGYKSYFLSDEFGNLAETHSISAGLDYAGVGPQLAHLHDIGRVEFSSARDSEALAAMQFFAKNEGILAALESSHALAELLSLIKRENLRNKIIFVNVSGRGDKDIFITAPALQKDKWHEFLKEQMEALE